jgi:hypothetical protein
VVEQGTHKPLVSGPNPLVATIYLPQFTSPSNISFPCRIFIYKVYL